MIEHEQKRGCPDALYKIQSDLIAGIVLLVESGPLKLNCSLLQLIPSYCSLFPAAYPKRRANFCPAVWLVDRSGCLAAQRDVAHCSGLVRAVLPDVA